MGPIAKSIIQQFGSSIPSKDLIQEEKRNILSRNQRYIYFFKYIYIDKIMKSG